MGPAIGLRDYRDGKEWVVLSIAAATVVLLIATVAYVVDGVVIGLSADHAENDAVLQAAFTDQAKIDKIFSDSQPASLDYSTPQAFQGQADKLRGRLKEVEDLIAGDKSRVGAARSRIQPGWLTVFENSTLTKDRDRLDATSQALDVAKTGLDEVDHDLASQAAYTQAYGHRDKADTADSAGNFAEVATDLNQAKNEMDAAQKLVAGLPAPPGQPMYYATFSRYIADYSQYATAAKAGDDTKTRRLGPTVDADYAAVTAVDDHQFVDWYTAHFKDLQKRYDDLDNKL